MILAILIGIAITMLGIWVMLRTNRFSKLKKVDAVVCASEPSTMKIGKIELPCVEVKMQIQTSNGIVIRGMKMDRVYADGEIIEIYYDEERDKLELASNVKTNKSSGGPLILTGFGVLWTLICIGAMYAGGNKEFAGFYGVLILYAMAILFIFAGIRSYINSKKNEQREYIDPATGNVYFKNDVQSKSGSGISFALVGVIMFVIAIFASVN